MTCSRCRAPGMCVCGPAATASPSLLKPPTVLQRDSVSISIAVYRAAQEAISEAVTASEKWPPFNSAHEGYAVLLEEVDELWSHVKTNQKRRDIPAMRAEAIQVAAMALRFVVDVCDGDRGRA